MSIEPIDENIPLFKLSWAKQIPLAFVAITMTVAPVVNAAGVHYVESGTSILSGDATIYNVQVISRHYLGNKERCRRLCLYIAECEAFVYNPGTGVGALSCLLRLTADTGEIF